MNPNYFDLRVNEAFGVIQKHLSVVSILPSPLNSAKITFVQLFPFKHGAKNPLFSQDVLPNLT